MSKDKSLGYFEWLKAQGVENSFENTYGHNKTQAKSTYSFASQKEAQNFKNKYLADGSSFGEVFFDQRLKKYVMPINLEAQELLKNQFQKEQPVSLTLEDCQRQMDLVEQAKEKVEKFNRAESTPGLQITRANYKKVDDRIGNVAKMLSNTHDKPGWDQHSSTSAIDIMLTVYSATNDHLLSPKERETINNTSQSILKTNSQGKFVGGLKVDANFVSYIEEQYRGDHNKGKRADLIRENTDQLLNGGQRIIVDKDTPPKLGTLAAQPEKPNSYTQPRFLPDQNGRSDTNEVIIHAGGMAGHSAMRVLKKEEDTSVPGGYRYFYTKIDAGGGLERVDHNTKTGTGIYTTEVTPYFKTRELPNGKLAVIYDSNGNPQKMNQLEITALNSNPKEYQRHMEANLFSLITAEREIVFYKNSGQLTVDHGEPTAIKNGKFDEWQFFNNKINGSRGVEVPERTKITPIQLTGNCTAYSVMLTATHLAGDAIGYDLMQSAKTYDQTTVMERLNQRKESIEQDTRNIKALSEVQNIFSLKPEQVVYQANKVSKISFADMHEAEVFKKSLSKTHNINVTSSKSKDGTSYNIELNPQQIGQIVSNAKGFNDVGLIQNLPEAQNCAIIKSLDSKKQKNYIVQFADKAEAEKFSKALNERYQIKGGSGGDKFVGNHITDDGRYGVILTETDINSLIPKLRQEEAAKQRKIVEQQKVVPLQDVDAPQKADKAPSYEIVISEKTLENINKYKENLISGQEQLGEFLRAKLEATGKSVENLSTSEFIEVMLSTKQPKFFAESAIQGGGIDWNNSELRILGDINVTVPVKIYDNGVWHKTVTLHDPITNQLTTKDDPNFVVHENPLDSELLFTPGALLKSGPGFSGKTPDLDEVTKDGKIDQEAYNALVERRLLPLLVHANEKAGLEGKPALITLPGVGAGEFAGEFKGEMGEHLNIAIQQMLEKHSGNLGNIAAIHYDSFAECQNEQRNYGNIKYRVRPELAKGNKGKTQLSDPKVYQDAGDDFSKCKLYKIVAWDHVSLPGNDYFEGSRYTDDGVAAAATSSMEGITGVKGRYDKETSKYLPPEGYNNWSDVASKQGVHLKVENNLKIVTDKGVSVKFADYQKVVDSPSITIPKQPILKPKPVPLEQVVQKPQTMDNQKPDVPQILGSKEAIIYSARDVKTHGPRVAVKFSDQTARDQFVDNFIKEAKKENVDLSNVFNTTHSGANDVVYINSSKGKGSVGTYVSDPAARGDFDSNPELSISFGNDKVAQNFSDLLGVNKHAYNSHNSGSLYFNASSLSPIPDKRSSIKVEINNHLSEQYVKNDLIPMVDSFVASHINGEMIIEAEMIKFQKDILKKLRKDGILSENDLNNFVESTEFKKSLQSTMGIIFDQFSVKLELTMTEKLMFSIGKLCENLGLNSISKVCMQQIKPENLEKITKREQVLARSLDLTSNANKSISNTDQTKIASSRVQNILSERAANRKGREV